MSAVCKGLRPEQGQEIRSRLELCSSARGTRDSHRRSFSANISSKKWLSQHFPLENKKEFSSAPESPATEAAEGSNKEPERQGQLDIWSAIQSQKAIDSNSSAPTTYVHPLVKRSKSLLSEKSLRICTESLGSESGSDGSSLSDGLVHSPIQRSEDQEEIKQETKLQDAEKGLDAENQNDSITQKLPVRSFPPPLPSLSLHDGPNLYIRPHRKDGRLLLEEVPVSSYNCFHTQRQGGRLVLTSVNTPPTDEKQETEEIDDHSEEEEEEQQEQEQEFLKKGSQLEIEKVEGETELNPEEKEAAANVVISKGKFVLEVQVTPVDRSSRVMTVHRLALVFNKMVGNKPPTNQNPWDEMRGGKREECKVVAPFNAYECYWRSNESPSHLSNKPILLKAQNFFIVRRCKEEPRRPMLIWEPRCIATS